MGHPLMRTVCAICAGSMKHYDRDNLKGKVLVCPDCAGKVRWRVAVLEVVNRFNRWVLRVLFPRLQR